MNDSISRPLITFALMAYNCERFVEEAVTAAFSQTYQPLEIILSDDCSSDRSFEILKTMARGYQGPHNILLNRNPRNVGVSGHINRVMELCGGDIVVIAAADDVSNQNRVEKIYDAYAESGCTAMSIHSSCIVIDETGSETGREQEYEKYEASLESVIESGTWIYGCTHAWNRNVFDRFGPLPLEVRREDEVIPFRSLLLGNISYIKEPLVRYRSHTGNISKATRRMPENKKELHELVTNRFLERLINLKCYLTDVEAAGDLVHSERREAIRKRLLKEIQDWESEIIIREGRMRDKLSVFFRVVGESDPASTAKLLLRILFPGACMTYFFHRYRKAYGGGGS